MDTLSRGWPLYRFAHILCSVARFLSLWEIDAPPTLYGLGHSTAALGVLHIHRTSGGGASISHDLENLFNYCSVYWLWRWGCTRLRSQIGCPKTNIYGARGCRQLPYDRQGQDLQWVLRLYNESVGRIGHKVISLQSPNSVLKLNVPFISALDSVRIIGFAFIFSEDLEIDEEPPPPPSAVAGMDIESPSPEQSLDGGEQSLDGGEPLEAEGLTSGIDEAEETAQPEEAEEPGDEDRAEDDGQAEDENQADEEEGKSEADDISEMEPEP